MEPSLPVLALGAISLLSEFNAQRVLDIQHAHIVDGEVPDDKLDAMESRLFSTRVVRPWIQTAASKLATATGLTAGQRCNARVFESRIATGRPAADGGSMRVRIYDPVAGRDAAEGRVVVYFHGGGFTFGELGMNEGLHCALSEEASATVARSAAKKIVVGGDSAGGNLATGILAAAAMLPGGPPAAATLFPDASLKWLAEPPSPPVAAWNADAAATVAASLRERVVGGLLVYPTALASVNRGSMVDRSDGHLLTRGAVRAFWEIYYRGKGIQARGTPWLANTTIFTDANLVVDRRAQPGGALRAALEAGRALDWTLPPTLSLLPQYDVLHDDGVALVEILRRATPRNPARHAVTHIPRATHGFVSVPEFFPETWPLAKDSAVAFLDGAFGRPAAPGHTKAAPGRAEEL
ncbi:hypothetical protein FNF28_04560 [Cafeteria roenbergensis]|uniref:Alpha/beta hydrolase fold-3 domain-containing protein n=1 Tax=Cafeteria roenbergensis TaxID=33653 RepID=A0A5A8DAY7_CAFRO|nr:hypothetical protein FNF28_04560 [Cafeteria roenbergensis]